MHISAYCLFYGILIVCFPGASIQVLVDVPRSCGEPWPHHRWRSEGSCRRWHTYPSVKNPSSRPTPAQPACPSIEVIQPNTGRKGIA